MFKRLFKRLDSVYVSGFLFMVTLLCLGRWTWFEYVAVVDSAVS
jgi:hypothetical protein